MYCKQCGQQIEGDSAFCRYCGTAQAPGVEKAPIADPAPLPEGSPSTVSTSWPLWVAGGLVLLLIFIALLGSPKPATPQTNIADMVPTIENAGVDTLLSNATAEKASPEAVPAPATWDYSTDEDKVRGTTSYFARTTSTNTVRQDSPYDAETTMSILVRKSADGTDVLLTISSGQMMCPSYEGCSGTVRFDDGPAQTIGFNGPADNSSETIFVIGAKDFIAKLKRSKRLIVEKTLYQAGNPQFEFDVSGLKWDH